MPEHAALARTPAAAEIYFSILQRKAVSPGDSADLDALDEYSGFQNRYNTAAGPLD